MCNCNHRYTKFNCHVVDGGLLKMAKAAYHISFQCNRTVKTNLLLVLLNSEVELE